MEGLVMESPVRGSPPMVTEVTSVKSIPAMTTVVPPDVGPSAGETEATCGGGMAYWNPPVRGPLPEGVVTTTSALPAVPGDVNPVKSVPWVVPWATVTPVKGCPPMVTVAPSTKPLPVMVTEVPPVTGPSGGSIDATEGPPSWQPATPTTARERPNLRIHCSVLMTQRVPGRRRPIQPAAVNSRKGGGHHR